VSPCTDAAAAAKAALGLQDTQAGLQDLFDTAAVADARCSPFEQKDVQLGMMRGAADAADDPQVAAEAAAAAAAAAASIALAGASSSAGLQHGWGSRRTSLRPGRHRSAPGPESMNSDALEQLADELRGDD
jgi:hypothetical protein